MAANPDLIFNATLAGTQYADGPAGVKIENQGAMSWTVVHPGPGTTTTYKVMTSNMTDDEVRTGLDDWAEYTLTTEPGAKSAAENFSIELVPVPPFKRARLRMVTSLGSGTGAVRRHIKGR